MLTVKNKTLLYMATAFMVFITIYTLGLRISIFTTGWDLITDAVPVLDWYRISIIGSGLLGIIFAIFYIRREFFSKIKKSSHDVVNPYRKFIISHLDMLLILALIFWLALSAVFNYDLGLMENLFGVAAIAVNVVTFYLIGKLFDREAMYFILKRVILWGSAMWNVGVTTSLAMYVINYSGYYKFDGFIRISRQGIMEGRLFGCFSNPNYAALITLLMIIGLVYLYYRRLMRGNIIVKAYIKITIFLFLCYLVLCGSRSGYVAFLGTATVFIVVFVYRTRMFKREGRKYIFSRKHTFIDRLAPIDGRAIFAYGVRIIAMIFATVVVYFLLMLALQGVGYIVSPDRDIESEFVRDDVSIDDISNSRFKIWMDYLNMVGDRPVTGFCVRGALIYADSKYPETYIAKRHYDSHTMFIQMLVQGGVVGLTLMLLFLVRLALIILKRIGSDRYLDSLGVALFGMLLIHILYCFFNTGVYVIPYFEAMLAWVAFGYLDRKCSAVGRKM